MPFTDVQPAQVTVLNPEQPFGGVIVQFPSETVVVNLGNGSRAPTEDISAPVIGAVESVFGRDGAVTAEPGDYSLDQISPPATAWTLPAGVRIKSGNAFQLWNPDQGKWHTLQVRGTAGAEYITIGAGES
jgi:hypothetical protein